MLCATVNITIQDDYRHQCRTLNWHLKAFWLQIMHFIIPHLTTFCTRRQTIYLGPLYLEGWSPPSVVHQVTNPHTSSAVRRYQHVTTDWLTQMSTRNVEAAFGCSPVSSARLDRPGRCPAQLSVRVEPSLLVCGSDATEMCVWCTQTRAFN